MLTAVIALSITVMALTILLYFFVVFNQNLRHSLDKAEAEMESLGNRYVAALHDITNLSEERDGALRNLETIVAKNDITPKNKEKVSG